MSESSMPHVAALILAAGKSTRMKSKTPKALHPLLGKPLLRWALDAVGEIGAARAVLVVGHEAEQVQREVGPDYEYVLQAEQRGTGHAVQMAGVACWKTGMAPCWCFPAMLPCSQHP